MDSKEMALKCAKILSDKLARDLSVIYVREVTSLADYFVISTGGSSLKAVDALRAAGFEVVGMVASYTYGFPVAEEAFKAANVRLVTLSDYEHTTAIAAKTGYIQESDLEVLKEWRKSPSTWKQ